MKHVKLYILNLFNALYVLIKAFAYVIVPRSLKDLADGDYARFNHSEMNNAMAWACERMVDYDIVPDSYAWRGNDCDDHAFAKCFFARLYLLHHFPDRLTKTGNPVGLFGYRKDNGDGHQIVKTLVDGGVVFYDSYSNKPMPMSLSRNERKSVQLDVM